jgi:hypothetical protein
MPRVKGACCRKSAAIVQEMACTTVWPLLLLSLAALLLLYPVLGVRHLAHTAPETKVFRAVPPRRSLDVEEDFLAPSTGAETRELCNGFTQLETLKGDWVDADEPSYRGLNPNSTCPSFVQDYSCLSPDYIPARYKERIDQVGTLLHCCSAATVLTPFDHRGP